MTAHSDLATRQRAERAGATSYLTKPFALQDLAGSVVRPPRDVRPRLLTRPGPMVPPVGTPALARMRHFVRVGP